MGDCGEAPPGLGSSGARPVLAANWGTAAPERRATQRAGREPHRRGRVAPRTSSQTFNTLMWAVILLFGINVFSHYCSLVADQRSVQVASHIEADFIQNTFSHVLKLPLRFFSQRASGTLANKIDQSDEIP